MATEIDKKPQGTPDLLEQGDDAPKFVTEEQLNRAISARLSSFEKKFEKTTADLGTSLSSKLEELLKASAEQPKKAVETKSPSDSPEMKALQKQLADVEARLTTEKAEKEKEKAAARDTSLRSTVQQHLTAAGISGAQLRHALNVLVDGEKRISFEEETGKLLFRSEADGDLPLESGLKGWLKSDDAKHYLPARGTLGSGERGTGSKNPNGGPPQPPRAGAALLTMAGFGDPNRE